MAGSKDLTKGPVWQNLLRLAGPMVFGIIAVISVSLIDTYYVSKLGEQPLAALSFTFPVTLAVSSLAIGLGAGASSVVSRAIGSSSDKEACRLATDSIVLGLLLVIPVAAIGYLTIGPLFRLIGAEAEVLELIGRYMRIWYLAIPLLVAQIIANAIVRAAGDAFWPSAVMVGSAVINIGITPVLIFGWGIIPAMDIEGAAWGTMIAWLFSLIIALWLVAIREKMITFAIPKLGDMLKSWWEILSVGVPAAFGNAVNPIGIAIVTGILAGFGTSVVAGFGVATRIESFSVIPMLALSSAIGPFCGQNWGADQKGRVISALKISYGVCLAWAVLISVVFWIFAAPIAGIFSSEPKLVDIATSYLWIVPLSVWGYGVVIVAAGAYNSIGRSKVGLGYYLTRTALFYVPISFLATLLGTSWYVFLGIAVANVLSGILVAVFSIRWLKD